MYAPSFQLSYEASSTKSQLVQHREYWSWVPIVSTCGLNAIWGPINSTITQLFYPCVVRTWLCLLKRKNLNAILGPNFRTPRVATREIIVACSLQPWNVRQAEIHFILRGDDANLFLHGVDSVAAPRGGGGGRGAIASPKYMICVPPLWFFLFLFFACQLSGRSYYPYPIMTFWKKSLEKNVSESPPPPATFLGSRDILPP